MTSTQPNAITQSEALDSTDKKTRELIDKIGKLWAARMEAMFLRDFWNLYLGVAKK